MAEYRLVRGEGGVYTLTFGGNGEHRMNPESMTAILTALDEVESDPSATALITTNEGKFYSNGLDLDYRRRNPNKVEEATILFNRMLCRFLSFPMPTIAAICGHAAAAGCILALAHDYRFMSSERGFIFLNEVEVSVIPSTGVFSLVRSKLPNQTFQKAFLSGQKYFGEAAVVAGLVDAVFPNPSTTLLETIRKANELAMKRFNRNTYKLLKTTMFETVHAQIAAPPGFEAKL